MEILEENIIFISNLSSLVHRPFHQHGFQHQLGVKVGILSQQAIYPYPPLPESYDTKTKLVSSLLGLGIGAPPWEFVPSWTIYKANLVLLNLGFGHTPPLLG